MLTKSLHRNSMWRRTTWTVSPCSALSCGGRQEGDGVLKNMEAPGWVPSFPYLWPLALPVLDNGASWGLESWCVAIFRVCHSSLWPTPLLRPLVSAKTFLSKGDLPDHLRRSSSGLPFHSTCLLYCYCLLNFLFPQQTLNSTSASVSLALVHYRILALRAQCLRESRIRV